MSWHVRFVPLADKVTQSLDLGEVPREESIRCLTLWSRGGLYFGKSIRRHRLAEEPRCRKCAIEGRIVAASHVDHIEPHLGQWLLFFKYENNQSSRAQHHHRHNHPEKRGNSPNKPTDRLVDARSAIRS